MHLEVGTIVEGKVTRITNFGAFVDIPGGKSGMIHISEISADFVKDIKDYLKIGQVVRAKVINVNEKNEIALSIKKLMPQKSAMQKSKLVNSLEKLDRRSRPDIQNDKKRHSISFEEMLATFKHKSEEKISDLKRTKESKRGNFHKRGSQH